MISTKGRYAIRLMIDLAEQDRNSTTPLDDIAARQDISKKYLEIIVKQLVKAQLVKGASGKGGGYKLLKDPQEYTVLEILKASEDRFCSVACLSEGAEPCERQPICKTLPMWKNYNKLVYDYFSGITLDDLVNNRITIQN